MMRLTVASRLASNDRERAARLLAAAEQPFAVDILHEQRSLILIDLALQVSVKEAVPFFEAFEPNIPWIEDYLKLRVECYAKNGHPLTVKAMERPESISRQ